ncbi:VanZ family protein [Salsuginibacillus kocurii]|uniref:VanZ family protein n=1 Tax=Salsuginibacillus kocurii TaxID=427078 RepID=UPI00037682D6|nr:VanZ family protein [Salsuginibacillus kocurii]
MSALINDLMIYFDGLLYLFILLSPLFILIGIGIYIFFKAGMNGKKAFLWASVYTLLMMSIVGIGLLTLTPSIGWSSVQLIPFYSMYNELNDPITYIIPIRNLGLNILLFVPFGFFLAARYYLKSNQAIIRRTTIGGAITSTTVEILQFVLPINRVSNIDDVILNTLGTFLGATVCYIFIKLIYRFIKPETSENIAA